MSIRPFASLIYLRRFSASLFQLQSFRYSSEWFIQVHKYLGMFYRQISSSHDSLIATRMTHKVISNFGATIFCYCLDKTIFLLSTGEILLLMLFLFTFITLHSTIESMSISSAWSQISSTYSLKFERISFSLALFTRVELAQAVQPTILDLRYGLPSTMLWYTVTACFHFSDSLPTSFFLELQTS